MSLLKIKLAQIEAQIQNLVENGAARILPFRETTQSLPERLLAAMEAGIQMDEDGQLIAPNLYVLSVHPSSEKELASNPSLLREFAQMILSAGLEAGLQFDSPPLVRVSGNPEIEGHEIQIRAQISRQQIGDTSTFAVPVGQGELGYQAGSPSGIPEDAFLIVNGEQIYPLSHSYINIGRRKDNHIVLDDRRVSRVHAQLRVIKGRFVIFDLDSAGGTFVNGERIKQATLYPGDVISLAGVPLVYGQDSSYPSNPSSGSTHPLTSFPHEK